MATYTEIKGDNQTSALQSNITALFETIDDPRGRTNTASYIYQSDPRSKSADFGSYPIIYIEDYNIENQSTNAGGNLFTKVLNFEFHVIINDDSAQQKQWGDQLADTLMYKFDFEQRDELAAVGIGQPSIERSNRVTGIDRKDQPVIRREFEVQAPTMIDMEQVDGDPYA